MSRLLPDWIDGFLEFTKNSEPPDNFRLWTAIATIAAALQRKAFTVWGMETFYPNLYIVLCGPSASRKGTAMGPGLKLLRKLGVKIASNAVTREALIKELNEAGLMAGGLRVANEIPSIHSSLTVFSKELTVFLGYKNLELMSNLCDWFDCDDDWTYTTKNSGVFHIMGVWFNLFGGTTPELLQASLPIEAFGSGLTSRIIFVNEPKSDKRVVMPSASERLGEKLLSDLEAIHLLAGRFRVTDGFIEVYADWYMNKFQCKLTENPRFEGYCGRRQVHLWKLSMVCAASSGDSLVLTEHNFRRALDILEATEINMADTFSGVGRSDTAAITDQILTYLGIHKKVELKHLMERFYRDADRDTLNTVLKTLISMNAVRCPTQGDKVFVTLVTKPEEQSHD